MNTHTFKKIAALAVAGALTLTLAACGDASEGETPAPVVTDAPVVTEKPAPAEETPKPEAEVTPEAQEDYEFDFDNPTVGTWAELDAYAAPEGADEIWGDKEASEGIKNAMEAMFMLYSDGNAGGLEGEERSVEDYAQLHLYTTESLSDIMRPIIKDAIAGDDDAAGTVGLFFPQSHYGETLEIDGERVLDEVVTGADVVIVDNATARISEGDDDYYLAVTVRHDVTYEGSFKGAERTLVITQDTRFSMLPAGDGSWKIDGINVEVVDFK